MTMAISKAKEEGVKVICASTETLLLLLLHTLRGGLKPYVLIPEGFVAQGKLGKH